MHVFVHFVHFWCFYENRCFSTFFREKIEKQFRVEHFFCENARVKKYNSTAHNLYIKVWAKLFREKVSRFFPSPKKSAIKITAVTRDLFLPILFSKFIFFISKKNQFCSGKSEFFFSSELKKIFRMREKIFFTRSCRKIFFPPYEKKKTRR